MDDTMGEPQFVQYRDSRDWQREQAENFRIAAMLGYGAMLAHNEGGRFKEVLAAIDKILNPTPL